MYELHPNAIFGISISFNLQDIIRRSNLVMAFNSNFHFLKSTKEIRETPLPERRRRYCANNRTFVLERR